MRVIIQNVIQGLWKRHNRRGGLKERIKARRGGQGRQGMPLVQKEMLIKICPFRDDHLLGFWVVELPSLVTLWITNEDALLHVRSKTPKWPLVLLNEHIGSTSPYTEPGKIRLGSKKCFMRGGAWKSSCGDSVVNMDKG